MKFPRVLALPVITIILLFLVCPAHARDEWIQVKSKNFFLIGNASEKDIRKVGTQLEQFRETFRLLLDKMNQTSSTPTNVVVFKSNSYYNTFKPRRSDGKIDTFVAGFFQPGEDVNYITLSTEGEDARTFSIIFHEYVHFVVNTHFGKSEVPAWFNEGLAEYYETFAIEDDQKVKLGLPQTRHLPLLQKNKLMPLGELFNISNRQLLETGDHSRSLFYAQSWALIHYLILKGKSGGLSKFLDAMIAAVPAEKAFQDAFQISYAQMEVELRKYIDQKLYGYQEITLGNKLVFDTDMRSLPLDEAATNAYLGDLLYHTNRVDDAEPYLQKALRLQPDMSLANTALGMVRMKQRKPDEARRYLEKAIAGDSKNHIALYRYAFLLSREGRDEFGYVRSFDRETTVKMRDALKKAIAINPAFTESYEMLGFINLVNNEELDESVTLLKTALKYQPGNQKYALRIAELLSRQEKLDEAGEMAAKILRTSDDPQVTARAQGLVDYITQRRAFDESRGAAGRRTGGPPPSLRNRERDTPLSEEEIAKRQVEENIRGINGALRQPADGELRVVGHVQKINCSLRAVGFVIKTPAGTFTLASKDFERLTLNAFEPAANGIKVGCDENLAAFRSVVTYRPRPASNATPVSRGELIAIEFVPANFRLMNEDEMAAGGYVIYEQANPDRPKTTSAPGNGPAPVDPETQLRALVLQGLKDTLKKPGPGEKREMGYLDRIECTSKGVYFHFRTATQQLKLLNASPETLPIRIFTPELDGLNVGCTLKPVDFPTVFIYTENPDDRARTAGEIVSVDFMPKSFVLD